MKGTLKNRKTKRWVVIISIGLIAVLAISYFSRIANARLEGESLYDLSIAEARDITVTLSGTGTLKPADAYNVVSVVSGDIIKAPFEEGDAVEKDVVLFEVDSSAVASNIETAQISLSESQRAYRRQLEEKENLNIQSNVAGVLVERTINVGDQIQMGQVVAKIQSRNQMRIKIPFLTEDAKTIVPEQEVDLTLTHSFEKIVGKVQEISALEQVDPSGRRFIEVTIAVENPGGLTNLHEATARIGERAGTESGLFYYMEEAQIVSKLSGEVITIGYEIGDAIDENAIIATVKSTTLEDGIVSSANAVRRSEINLDSQKDTLENYRILSPIGGTVIEKIFKEGDTLTAGQVMATIFDLSYLTMTLNIDELDISKIQVGQAVVVTADAVSGKAYEGKVTRININGSTVGGTTTYPVTVQIDQTEGLLPGMNVDAKIKVQSKTQVVSIPTQAVLRGSKVLVKLSPDETSELTGPLEGYKYVTIVTGISDTNFTEVLEGLSLGDAVAIEKRNVNTFAFPTGRPGAPDTSYEEVDIP